MYHLILMIVITGCSQKYQLDSGDLDVNNFDTASLYQEKKLEVFAIKQILFDGLLRSCSRPEINYANDLDLCIYRLASKEHLELIQQNRLANNAALKNLPSRSDVSLKNVDLLILLLGDIGAGNLEGLSSLVGDTKSKRENQLRYLQSKQNQRVYLQQIREQANQNSQARKKN